MDFFKEWGTLIVAISALLQPILIALWKKYLRGGSIEIYETGTIEIGYSTLGATIGLRGTLRSVHRDFFISTIKLKLEKQKDSSKHHFEWSTFRTAKTTLSSAFVNMGAPSREVTIELPHGLLINSTQPNRFDILFFDATFQDELKTPLENISDEWSKNYRGKFFQDCFDKGMTIADAGKYFAEQNEELYKAFTKQKIHLDTYVAIDRALYWDEGEYILEAKVIADKPNVSFSKQWKFKLSKSDCEKLRINTINILQETLNVPFGQYNFAYPKFMLVNDQQPHSPTR